MNPNNHSNTSKLINAAITGKQEIIEDILTNSIETINAKDKDGNTALMHAMCCGHIEIAALILNHAKAKEILDINIINNNHDTVLMFAAIYTPNLVEVIMKNYPQIDNNLRNLEGCTALMYAAKNNKLNAVKAILSSSKTQVDFVDNDQFKCTALLWAVYGGNPEIVKEIVDFSIRNGKDLNINSQNCDGMTALMLAVELAENKTKLNLAKSCAMVKTLLKVPGINLGLSTPNDKFTALMYIADYGNLEMLKAFLEISGGNDSDPNIINAKDKYGSTALIYSAAKGDPKMFQELLNIRCIDTTIKDQDGRTVFMYAAKSGNVDTLQAFINIKSSIEEDIDAKDNNGFTALMLAKSHNHVNMVKKFLSITCSHKTLLFSTSDKYVGSIKKLIVALQQVYCEASTYLDVINASSPTNKLKPLKLSEEQATEIKLLISKRYQSCGGMCKPIEMIRLKNLDKEKLQSILDLSLIWPGVTIENIQRSAAPYIKKRRKSRFSSEALLSDDSNDDDYVPGNKKNKYYKI